ncbi:MAG: hypothetical protein JSS98_17350 [Bacteroidetes bacterium]|nr:hypothetical protein [Bacteroidota bacterium]
MKTFIFWGLTVFLFAAGCKKNTEKNAECRIAKISGPLSMGIFSYDAQGRILSVNNGTSNTSFTYVGDSIIKQGTWKSVYALNSNGLLAFERREYNSSGTQWERRIYEYDGMQIKKMTSNSYSGNFIRTYIWSNGNLLSEQTLGATYSQLIQYEYYTDKTYRLGDKQSLDLLENGVEYIRNKNLVKKYISTYIDNSPSNPTPGIPEIETANYSYAFDSKGKIISMTASNENNSNPTVYTYEYRCD